MMNTFDQLKEQAKKEYEHLQEIKKAAARDLEMRRAGNLGKAVAIALQAISEREQVALEDLQDYSQVVDENWYSNPEATYSGLKIKIDIPFHLVVTIYTFVTLDHNDKNHRIRLASDWIVDEYGAYYKKVHTLGEALVWAEISYQNEIEEMEKEEQINAEQAPAEKKPEPVDLLEEAIDTFYSGSPELAQVGALLSIAKTLETMRKNGIFTVPH